MVYLYTHFIRILRSQSFIIRQIKFKVILELLPFSPVLMGANQSVDMY